MTKAAAVELAVVVVVVAESSLMTDVVKCTRFRGHQGKRCGELQCYWVPSLAFDLGAVAPAAAAAAASQHGVVEAI